ncbi:MAG: orotate phosphoribosyltransferase [Thermoanaerobaculia bacterium]
MIDSAALLRQLEESGALKRGHFLLSSGLHSPAYVQCALLLEDPLRARRIGEELAALLQPLEPRSVLSPALGGLIIGHETAAALGVPFRFTERTEGRMELRRGFSLDRGERIVIVEDVVTTGRSSGEAASVAEGHGAELLAVGAILDRTGGRGDLSVPLVALMELDLPAYPAAACPLCDQGGEPEKPGSRSRPGSP